MMLCFGNIFLFFVSFFPNMQLFSFLVTQKDAPERHEKAEKKLPPKGIYLSILQFFNWIDIEMHKLYFIQAEIVNVCEKSATWN